MSVISLIVFSRDDSNGVKLNVRISIWEDTLPIYADGAEFIWYEIPLPKPLSKLTLRIL